ncbi:MAG: ATP-dependent Clp protease adaptor ClpS [Rhizobacter sp.]|nr:ATP-dependent Clp protease adaptor ClpS [Rhizobacter sp.]
MNPIVRLKRWYQRVTAAPVVPHGMSFHAIGLLDASQFKHGIEVVNDETTPFTFVLQALQRHVGLSRGDAHLAAVICHAKGGVLLPVASFAVAQESAARISQDAQRHAYPLICRAVSSEA